MSFIMKDDVIYDELFDVAAPLGTEHKGDGVVAHNVFGFYMKDAESAGEEIALIYRCRQVLAHKKIGTGEEIHAGDRLYSDPASTPIANLVSPTQPAGTAGVDWHFVGWAKRDAGALDTTVLMNFDGTRHDQTA